VVTPLFLALSLLQPLPCRADAAQHVAAAVARGDVFDLIGAANAYFTAAAKGCVEADVPGHYLRGLMAARDAHAAFAAPGSLAPVRDAIALIDARGGTVPGLPQIARLVLQAAAAAAQSERAEMALFLDQAIQLEALQLEAGQPPLPVVTAHEAAGDLWLLVRDYENARRAYLRAAERLGTTPRIRLGLARVAARVNDGLNACRQFRAFVWWWGARTGEPPEVAEARQYLMRPACGR
jgi:hypothetical protein